MHKPSSDPSMKKASMGRRAVASVLNAVSAGLLLPTHGLVLARGTVDYAKFLLVDFQPRPDDIFIATYPRSGTTWMQMILYQMTTNGEMDFEHITQVCPWYERVLVNGRDLELLPSPRVFKTHLRGWLLPKKCRRIYVARNGKDVAVSFYRFYRSHFGFTGEFAEFFKMFLDGKVQGGSWFTHVAGWWKRRNEENVLFLRYEELSSNLKAAARKIGDFLEIELSEEQMQRIVERSSFDFMKQHEGKFDHTTELQWEQGQTTDAFLRKGKTGEGSKELSAEQQLQFDALFHKKLGAFKRELGLRD